MLTATTAFFLAVIRSQYTRGTRRCRLQYARGAHTDTHEGPSVRRVPRGAISSSGPQYAEGF